jgi:hypothetical protein
MDPDPELIVFCLGRRSGKTRILQAVAQALEYREDAHTVWCGTRAQLAYTDSGIYTTANRSFARLVHAEVRGHNPGVSLVDELFDLPLRQVFYEALGKSARTVLFWTPDRSDELYIPSSTRAAVLSLPTSVMRPDVNYVQSVTVSEYDPGMVVDSISHTFADYEQHDPLDSPRMAELYDE